MAAYKVDPKAFVSDVANNTMVGLGIGMGSSIGIFDVMSTLQFPMTASKIAELGNWKLRYITEWLNLMVCGSIVEYNAKEETYFLPEAMRPVVSSYGKVESLGTFIELFNIICVRINEVSACFPQNGPKGVPYSSFHGFRDWMKKFRDVTIDWHDLNKIYQMIPGLVNRLEIGLKVVDGGCNTGNHILMTAEHYPNSFFTGFDMSDDALNIAREISQTRKLDNMEFQFQDGCKLPTDWTNSFDVFTANDVLHDVSFPKLFLQEALRVLKPGGIFLMSGVNLQSKLEGNIGNGLAPSWYGISLLHCMTAALSEEGGEGLGCCWGLEKQRKYLSEAGFENIIQLDVTLLSKAYFIGFKPE